MEQDYEGRYGKLKRCVTNEAEGAITHGTSNELADLGYTDAEERQTKLRLAHTINHIIASRRLTQADRASRQRSQVPPLGFLPPTSVPSSKACKSLKSNASFQSRL
ncbi:MAG: XRE family transcriptional regulator [Alphaproteobacteria bacterium]